MIVLIPALYLVLLIFSIYVLFLFLFFFSAWSFRPRSLEFVQAFCSSEGDMAACSCAASLYRRYQLPHCTTMLYLLFLRLICCCLVHCSLHLFVFILVIFVSRVRRGQKSTNKPLLPIIVAIWWLMNTIDLHVMQTTQKRKSPLQVKQRRKLCAINPRGIKTIYRQHFYKVGRPITSVTCADQWPLVGATRETPWSPDCPRLLQVGAPTHQVE